MRERIAIREVGLRDGLHNIAFIVPTEHKTAWLSLEHAAGVREMEVTSLVPPKLLPQFADSEPVARHALGLDGLTVSALIPDVKGAERGIALRLHELNYALSASESRNQANVRRSTRQSIDDCKRIVEMRDGTQAAKPTRIIGGIANVLAALDVGVRRFDASLGGLGGCPYAPGASGNIVLEDTVFIAEAMGLDTGIDLQQLFEVRRTVQANLPGVTLLGGTAKAGLPRASAA